MNLLPSGAHVQENRAKKEEKEGFLYSRSLCVLRVVLMLSLCLFAEQHCFSSLTALSFKAVKHTIISAGLFF